MTKHSDSELLGLIDLIYSCAEGASSWSTFAHTINEYLGATASGILARSSVQAVVGVDPAEMMKYAQYYGLLYPCAGLKYPEGTAFITEELVSLDVIQKSEYYNDWGKKNRCGHALGGDVRVAPDVLLTFKLNRGDFGSPFSEHDRQIVQLLMPHLKRAISIYNRLNVLEERAWILEGLTYPMMYVSSRGVVRWANGAASSLLRREKGLRLRDSKLRAKNIADNTRLQKLLREGRAFEDGRVDGYGGWLRIADEGTELSLLNASTPEDRALPWPTGGLIRLPDIRSDRINRYPYARDQCSPGLGLDLGRSRSRC